MLWSEVERRPLPISARNSVSLSKQKRSVFGSGQAADGTKVAIWPVTVIVPATGAESEARKTRMLALAVAAEMSRDKMKRTSTLRIGIEPAGVIEITWKAVEP